MHGSVRKAASPPPLPHLVPFACSLLLKSLTFGTNYGLLYGSGILIASVARSICSDRPPPLR